MKFSRIQDSLTVFFLVAVFGLIWFRANNLAFTTDEAFTYNFFVRASWWRVLFLDQSVSANNHFALTVLLKLIISKLSISEFALRLPTVLSFGGLTGFFIYHRRKINFSFAILFFSFVLSSHLLLDLFSLARGYGISFCLLIVHFYYLGFFFKSGQEEFRNVNLATFILFVAVSFNLNLLHYSLAYFSVLLLDHFLNSSFNWKSITTFFARNKILFLFIVYLFPVFQLMRYKQFYFGGKVGIFEDSIIPLFSVGWNSTEYFFGQTISYFAWLIIFFVALFSVYYLFRVIKVRKLFWESQFSILLFLCLLAEFFQHMFFGTPFLLERSALIYWILFGGVLSSFLSGQSIRMFPLAKVFSFGLSLILMVFPFFIPVSYSPTWKFDASNREILPLIISDNSKTLPIRVCCDWYYEPGLNYYRHFQGFTDKISEIEREDFGINDGNYYVISKDRMNEFEGKGFKVLKYFPESDTYILKRI